MTAFTDEQIKELKSDNSHTLTDMEWAAKWGPDEINALLARLEAAEECIGYNARHSEWESRYEAWRKAAGKDR